MTDLEISAASQKKLSSIDTRVMNAISKTEKQWKNDGNLNDSPKLKLVIAFEGLDSKMNVIEDRHEFVWRPNPSTASKWMDLEHAIVVADVNQSEEIQISTELAKLLPEIPWRYSTDALRSLGLLDAERDLVSRAWIEVVPGALDLVIYDATIAVDPITFVWKLNTEDCSREDCGFKCKFMQASSESSNGGEGFKYLDKIDLRMSHDDCLKLGKETRKDKLWRKAANADRRRAGCRLGASEKDFFATKLARAFSEDYPALEACSDAIVLDQYHRDQSLDF